MFTYVESWNIVVDLIDRGYHVPLCRIIIAEAYFDLAEFRNSRIYIERVLKQDPNNSRALELHDKIKVTVAQSKCYCTVFYYRHNLQFV